MRWSTLKMREDHGDIWTYEPCDAIVIPTNGVWDESGGRIWAVMGKGVAGDCKAKVPGIESILGLELKQHGNFPYVLCNLMREGHNGNGPYIVSFPTKHHWRNPSDIMLIIRSARHLERHATYNGWNHVVMPRVGAGQGRLPWPVVKRTLENILDDRFVVLDGESQ